MTGGQFTATSTVQATQAAKRAGPVVSYDLNYRPSLWKSSGGKTKAQEINHRLAPLIDVLRCSRLILGDGRIPGL